MKVYKKLYDKNSKIDSSSENEYTKNITFETFLNRTQYLIIKLFLNESYQSLRNISDITEFLITARYLLIRDINIFVTFLKITQ